MVVTGRRGPVASGERPNGGARRIPEQEELKPRRPYAASGFFRYPTTSPLHPHDRAPPLAAPARSCPRAVRVGGRRDETAAGKLARL